MKAEKQASITWIYFFFSGEWGGVVVGGCSIRVISASSPEKKRRDNFPMGLIKTWYKSDVTQFLSPKDKQKLQYKIKVYFNIFRL